MTGHVKIGQRWLKERKTVAKQKIENHVSNYLVCNSVCKISRPKVTKFWPLTQISAE